MLRELQSRIESFQFGPANVELARRIIAADPGFALGHYYLAATQPGPDGQAAYDRFKSEKPDLVVLEAILPKIHGFDLTKKIAQESGGRVPVIIVTGLYRGPQYKHEALSSFGAADYFEKPVDKEKFVSSVMQLLHDEEDIEEDLPDSDSVIESLNQGIQAKPARTKERSSKESRGSEGP